MRLDPLEGPGLDPCGRIALQHPHRVEGDDHLRITVDGVEMPPECSVDQSPHHDSARFGKN